MFGPIKALIERVNSYDIAEAFDRFVSDPELRAHIIRLNHEQLYNFGIDSKGKSLGQYRPATVAYKLTQAAALGRDNRYDHITLKDTGDFYRSFSVGINRGIVIRAQTQKEDHDLADIYGREIIGLTNESIQDLKGEIRPRLIRDLRTRVAG